VISLITWEGVRTARQGDGFEVGDAGFGWWLADQAPCGRGVVAVGGCGPYLGVGKLNVLDGNALPLFLL
jgi:hypothetical protein